jgi:hypothetical protein
MHPMHLMLPCIERVCSLLVLHPALPIIILTVVEPASLRFSSSCPALLVVFIASLFALFLPFVVVVVDALAVVVVVGLKDDLKELDT